MVHLFEGRMVHLFEGRDKIAAGALTHRHKVALGCIHPATPKITLSYGHSFSVISQTKPMSAKRRQKSHFSVATLA
jgi:hypothetical protein